MIRAAYRVACRPERCRNWPAPARRISYAGPLFCAPDFPARVWGAPALHQMAVGLAWNPGCLRDDVQAGYTPRIQARRQRKSDKPRAKRIERGRFGIERG